MMVLQGWDQIGWTCDRTFSLGCGYSFFVSVILTIFALFRLSIPQHFGLKLIIIRKRWYIGIALLYWILLLQMVLLLNQFYTRWKEHFLLFYRLDLIYRTLSACNGFRQIFRVKLYNHRIIHRPRCLSSSIINATVLLFLLIIIVTFTVFV